MTAKDQARGFADNKGSNKLSTKKGVVSSKNGEFKINSIGFDYNKISQVIDALENPKYKWRTISGISKETGINPQMVTSILSVSDTVVKSSRQSIDGQDLFTTRSRFNSIASPGEKLIGAIKNRLD